MGIPKRTFRTRVKDKLGWGYKDAFVTIRFASGTAQTTFTSEPEDCVSDYKAALEAGVIVYQGNWWDERTTQLAGLPSRPLIYDCYTPAEIIYERDDNTGELIVVDGQNVSTGKSTIGFWSLGDLLSVDLTTEESKRIQREGTDPETVIFDLIQADVVARGK